MKQCYTFITLVCLCTTLSTAFAHVFWSEDFSDGLPSTWINDGPGLWTHCDTPPECAPNVFGPNNTDLDFGTFQSSSVDNGYVFYNSFSWQMTHSGILRTPDIDISGQDQVFLDFLYSHSHF